MDTYEGRNADPVSLHTYLYAKADPLGYADPGGHTASAHLANAMAMAVNLGLRLAIPATRATWMVAQAAGVSTIGAVGVGRVAAVGVAAERAIPPGLSIGALFSPALRLPKNSVIGSYRFMSKAIAKSGRQANHLNQKAAFPMGPADDMLSVSLEGGVNIQGSEHWYFHNVLEKFWSQFRSGGARYGDIPTNAEYDEALREALAAAGKLVDDLATLAEHERRALGYFDGPGGIPPNVPSAIPGYKH